MLLSLHCIHGSGGGSSSLHPFKEKKGKKI
jgi:hypothetical protein